MVSYIDEEKTYTYSEVIAHVREKLSRYIEKIGALLEASGEKPGLNELGARIGKAAVSGATESFDRIAVVDGGSNILSLNIGYIGVVVAVGVLIAGNRIEYRVLGEPEIVPSDPRELPLYENPDMIGDIADKLREALVFETARRLLKHKPDLLIVDGPIIPYGALAKKTIGSSSEEYAWKRYRESVINLHRESVESEVNVIGFVKRPRSKYISMKLGVDGFDHVLLSKYIDSGEYAPDPPWELDYTTEYFHEKEVAEIIKSIRPRYTYIRLTSSTPPYRVDIAHVVRSYREILSYLYRSRTREGIPYPLMKADEDTKLTRKLVRELYEDALHNYIVRYARDNPDKIIPILPEYGGVWS